MRFRLVNRRRTMAIGFLFRRLYGTLTNAAVAPYLLIGDPPPLFTCKESNYSRDIAWLADAERGTLFQPLLPFFREAAQHLGFHRARQHRVNRNSTWRAFRGGIGRTVRK